MNWVPGRGWTYKTDAATRKLARERRKRFKDLGVCINGEKHGKATHGVRCESCDKTHKKSAG